jgi:nicotinamidase-related amidase
MASRLNEFLNYYRANSLGEVIWVICCPWVKGQVHPSIDRLYATNPASEFYTDGTGAADFYQVSPQPQERVFEKNLYSAFSGTRGKLQAYLETKNIEHLLFSGVYSTGCVNASICEAFHLGHKISIVKDCVETFDRSSSQQHQQLLFHDWQQMYGDLVSSSEMMTS